MSVISLFFKKSPEINGYQFDATLEDTFEASVELTRYPVESGARVNDHRIINPVTYYLVGAISNNPLKPMLTDFIGGGLSNLAGGNPYVATVAGMSAGFLSGSDNTRASSTLEFLLELMATGIPFDIDAVDIQLTNMLITRLSRTRDPENEGGLIFIAEMQELINLDRLPDKVQPTQEELPDGDPAKSGAAADIERGQQAGAQPSGATTFAVNEVASPEPVPI